MWSQAQTMRISHPRATRPIGLLCGALVATSAAWVAFARLPPMPARVGWSAVEATVPLGYHLSVFPAFGAFLGALALDVLHGEARRTWLYRALMVLSVGTLSVARLAGVLPLSGHALFLFAMLGYEIAPPSDRDSATSLGLVVPALLVVAWCKLVIWGDPIWFCASAALGATLGVVLARAARA
jgi:hypothetical protein